MGLGEPQAIEIFETCQLLRKNDTMADAGVAWHARVVVE